MRGRSALGAFLRRRKAAFGGQLVPVLFFGSEARGEAHSGSDIDFNLLAKKNTAGVTEKIVKITGEILLGYEIVLSLVSSDLSEERKTVELGSFFCEAGTGVPI